MSMLAIMKHTQSFLACLSIIHTNVQTTTTTKPSSSQNINMFRLTMKATYFFSFFLLYLFYFVVVLLVMQACILCFVALTQWCEVQELGLSNVFVVNKMVVLFWCDNVKA
jgi:hypothetical protein